MSVSNPASQSNLTPDWFSEDLRLTVSGNYGPAQVEAALTRLKWRLTILAGDFLTVGSDGVTAQDLGWISPTTLTR